VFNEQDRSRSALISLITDPGTERVKTTTPEPDLDLFHGISGPTKRGEMAKMIEIAGRIMQKLV
jgi:hypothetical protein